MRTWLRVVLVVLLAWVTAGAQATSANGVLLEMAGQASVIFSGNVEQVTRQDQAGYVDVRFRVERCVRGCREGGIYVLREWAGLWTGGVVRYAAGQRRLMLLAGRGPSGMSSPVWGMDGAVPLFGDADGTERVDLRWVRARALRGVVAGAASGAGITGQEHADPFLNDWPGPVLPMAAGGPGASTQEPDLATVIALLGGSGGV